MQMQVPAWFADETGYFVLVKTRDNKNDIM